MKNLVGRKKFPTFALRNSIEPNGIEISIHKDHNEIVLDLIKNGNKEKIFTTNENLQLLDEEIVTLKLGGYFLNEEELVKR